MTVAGKRRAQLQFHEGAQQIVALSAGLAQALDAEFGVISGGLAGPKAGDRGADVALAQVQLAHQAARRVDFRLGHPAVGFGDMAHEFERRAEELVGNRQRGPRLACAGPPPVRPRPGRTAAR